MNYIESNLVVYFALFFEKQGCTFEFLLTFLSNQILNKFSILVTQGVLGFWGFGVLGFSTKKSFKIRDPRIL